MGPGPRLRQLLDEFLLQAILPLRGVRGPHENQKAAVWDRPDRGGRAVRAALLLGSPQPEDRAALWLPNRNHIAPWEVTSLPGARRRFWRGGSGCRAHQAVEPRDPTGSQGVEQRPCKGVLMDRRHFCYAIQPGASLMSPRCCRMSGRRSSIDASKGGGRRGSIPGAKGRDRRRKSLVGADGTGLFKHGQNPCPRHPLSARCPRARPARNPLRAPASQASRRGAAATAWRSSKCRPTTSRQRHYSTTSSRYAARARVPAPAPRRARAAPCPQWCGWQPLPLPPY